MPLAVLVIALLLLISAENVFSAPNDLEHKKEVARREFEGFKKRHGHGWKMKFDKKTGLPRTLYGARYRALSGGPERAARRFLNDNYKLFLLDKNLADLRTRKIARGSKTEHVSLQQYYKGLKVFRSGMDVHLRKGGKVHYVKNRYKLIGDMKIEPAVGLDEAMSLAEEDIGIEGPHRKEPRSELVIYPFEDQYLLSWRLLIPSSEPLGTWLVFVDAIEGRVLFKQDILRRFKGK